MFSKACEYGIKAMIFIARQNGEAQRISLKEISRGVNSPEAFTAKILQILSRNGLLISSKGPNGGFVLQENAREVTLAQIVEAIDGDSIFTGCGLGLEECNASKPCPMHFKFARVRDELAAMLHATTLSELAKGLKGGRSFLTR